MRTARAARPATEAYIYHCMATEAVLYEERNGEVAGATAVHMPVLLLTGQALLALSSGGTQLAADLPLTGAVLSSIATQEQCSTLKRTPI